MRIKFLWGIFVTILFVGSSGGSSLVMAQTPDNGGLKLLTSNDQEIVLELSVPDFQVETIAYEGQSYQRLLIPEMAQTNSPGDPQAPMRGVFLGIPSTEGVSVEVVEADYETLSGYRLYPAPALELIGDNITDPSDIEGVREVFTLNQDRYATDAFYPGGLAEIGETAVLRDQPVASVQFYPVQYNPVSGEMQLYRRIVARVTWSTALSSQAAGQTRRASPTYEQVLQNTLLNYDSLDRSAAMQESPLLDTTMSAASSTDKLKIGVTEDGIYQLTPGDLSGEGFSVTDLRNIKMKNRGVEIPIYVHDEDGDYVFDDGSDYILFYGTAITDVYTTKNIYWLEEGSSPGARMSERSVPPGGATLATEFPTTLHTEEDTEYWVVMPNGEGQDHWFWGTNFNASESRNYSLPLYNVSKTGGSVTVRVRLHGKTDPSHTTRIYLNGTLIDTETWSGQVVKEYEVPGVSDALLIDGLNTITVEAGGSGLNQFYVNWIELDYRDTYVAENNELLFGAPSPGNFKFNVTGFSSSDIQVFDVTTPTNVKILINTTTASGSVQFQDTAGTDTRYLALTSAQYKSPASIELDEPSNLKGPNNGHYIIITHEDFYSSAQALATHRSSTGVTAGKPVAIVKVEDIYDEFNYGIFNPQAIRDFISYADKYWGGDPAYVLLLGGASYDYRDILSLIRDNFVPTQMIETDLLGQTPSDNWFVTDDILPYMSIGRLTAQIPAEAADMVNKIIYYETHPPGASWNTDVLLVADDDDPIFETNAELIADALSLFGSYTFDRVYVGDYPSGGDPTTDIKTSIDSGKLLVHFSGHGNVNNWGVWNGGYIYQSSNIPSLNNTNKLPLVTAATCLNGYFAGQKTSMAEEFLKRSNKGAVAVWADAGEGVPNGQQVLMDEFYDAIFDNKYALGKAAKQAKINTYAQNSAWAEMVETFSLFGDPAMQLGGPAQETGSGPVFLPIVIKND